MKRTFAIVWLLLIAASASAADTGLGELLGEQVTLAEKVQALSQSGDCGAIYELLGSDYQGVVTKDVFIRTSKSPSWVLTKLQIGTLHQYSRTAYMPVRDVVTSGLKREDVDSVLFFVKEEKGWRLQNFPFLETRSPDFAVIPA